MPTKIEWATETWNPILGCSRVSEACRNCYAERFAHRAASNPNLQGRYAGLTKDRRWTGRVRLIVDSLEKPDRWRKPRLVFVGSMTDVFHPEVPDDWLDLLWEVMERNDRHRFLILTKRPERMADWLERRTKANGSPMWIGLGTSVEDSPTAAERVPHLLRAPAWMHYVSAEPLHGSVEELARFLPPAAVPGVDWVIAGGESGPWARPCHPDWLRELRDLCAEAEVPFLLKQWGEWGPRNLSVEDEPSGAVHAWTEPTVPVWNADGLAFYEASVRVGKKAAGRELDGAVHDAFPAGFGPGEAWARG